MTIWIACQASGADPSVPPAAALSFLLHSMQLVGHIAVAGSSHVFGVSWRVHHTFNRQLCSGRQATCTAAALLYYCELLGC